MTLPMTTEKTQMVFDEVLCGKGKAYRIRSRTGREEALSLTAPFCPWPSDGPLDALVMQSRPYLFTHVNLTFGDENVFLVAAKIAGRKCTLLVFPVGWEVWLVPMQIAGHLFADSGSVFECILHVAESRLEIIDCLRLKGVSTNGMPLSIRSLLAWLTAKCWLTPTPKDRLTVDACVFQKSEFLKPFIDQNMALLKPTMMILLRTENETFECERNHQLRMQWRPKS